MASKYKDLQISPEVRVYRKPKKLSNTFQINKNLVVSVITCALIFILVCLQFPFLNEDSDDSDSVDTLFESWRTCFSYNIRKFRNNSNALFQAVPGIVADCDKKPLFKRLNPQSFAGKWWHLSPVYSDEPGTVVALNVYNNDALSKLKKEVDATHTSLFLSSSHVFQAKNESGVVHFPFQVGAENGFQVEKPQGGVPSIVTKVNLAYFLTKTINITSVDNLWLNGNSEDYEILNYFPKNGQFEASNITLCQTCLQLPRPSQRDKLIFHNFLFQLVEDGRYALFKTRTAGRVSMYIVDMESTYCRKLFSF